MLNIMQWLESYPLLVPLFIIVARMTDVSMGTVRTILLVRGRRWTAAAIGFVEVIIWVLAVSGVLSEPTLVKVIAYGLGFALGNALGVWIENELAIGDQRVVAISKHFNHAIAMALRMADYTVTEVPARGGQGAVAMCFVIAPRKHAGQITRIIRGADEDAIVVVEDVRETVMARRPLTAVASGATGWRAILKKK